MAVIEKLCSRRQKKDQQQQATKAVRFFYSLIREDGFVENSEHEISEIKEHTSPYFKVENDNRVKDDNTGNEILMRKKQGESLWKSKRSINHTLAGMTGYEILAGPAS